MRPLLLVRDGLRTAWASRVPSALVAFVAAVMCAATLMTVGRTAAAEEQVLARLEWGGSRMLVVTDAKDSGLITPAVRAAAGGLDGAQAVLGMARAVDVTAGPLSPGGPAAPLWRVQGELSDAVELTSGRLPASDREALVLPGGAATLSLEGPAGWVAETAPDGAHYSVVGTAVPREGFESTGAGLVAPAPPDASSATLHVLAAHAARAPGLQGTVLDIVRPASPDEVRVTSPATLAQLQSQVAGDLGAFGRVLLWGVLGGGALLVGVVVLADVLVKRRDVGRRRALGATRSDVVGLILVRTVAPVVVGAALGVAVGVLATAPLGAVPPPDFLAGTAVLVLLAGALASVPPALFAATRDPVRVLRTP